MQDESWELMGGVSKHLSCKHEDLSAISTTQIKVSVIMVCTWSLGAREGGKKINLWGLTNLSSLIIVHQNKERPYFKGGIQPPQEWYRNYSLNSMYMHVHIHVPMQMYMNTHTQLLTR